MPVRHSLSPIPMELLAPAGGMEQLRAAVRFGADAVYLAAEKFGMRARAANFAMADIPAAVAFAHEHGVKVHVTCNILMHPDDIDGLPAFFRALDAAGVDAFIISDLGAFAVAGEVAPRVERHVSTQASVANGAAALSQGSTEQAAEVDVLAGAAEMAKMGILPEGMYRNRTFAQSSVDMGDTPLYKQDVLFDPQTAGGLLIAVDRDDADALLRELTGNVPSAQRIGEIQPYEGGARILLR